MMTARVRWSDVVRESVEIETAFEFATDEHDTGSEACGSDPQASHTNRNTPISISVGLASAHEA
jgi:hypothetical protein